MSKKRKRRTGRPTRRLHSPKPPTLELTDEELFWVAALVPHVLASDETPPEEAAQLILEFSVPFPALVLPHVIGHSTVRRVVEVAEAALRLAPDSPRSLAFAAQVASVEGDHTRAASLMEAAWSAGDGNDALRQVRAVVLVAAGRILEALPDIDALCAEKPDNYCPQALRAEALTLVERRVAEPPGVACPCGSSRSYGDCCRGGDLEALRRFGDRVELDALGATLLEHLERQDGFSLRAAEEWRQACGPWWRDDSPLTRSERVLRDLWVAGWTASVHGDDNAWVGAAPRSPTVLEAFAALPETRRHHSDLVDAWVGAARLGMWQVEPDQRGPGVMVVDLLTSVKIYARIDPSVRDEVACPWSVLVGWMVPVGGMWRSLPGHVVLSPAEADTMLGRVNEVVGVMDKRDPDVPSDPAVEAIPPSLVTDPGPPHPPHVVMLMVATAGGMLPELLARARAGRSPHPFIGDPAERVRARVVVDDLGALWTGLLERDHITRPCCDELWWSTDPDPVSGLRKEAMHDLEDGDSVVATIRLDEGCLAVSVPLSGHLDDLLAVMREVEPSALVARQAISPPTDCPVSWAATSGVTAASVDLWELQWPDQAAFALHCCTPREAAQAIRTHPLLELLLRELEFHSARVRAEGRPAPDMAAVRERLDMTLPPTMLTVPAAA